MYTHKYSFASSSIIFVYSKNIYVFDLVIIFEKNFVFNNILHKQNTTPTTNTENIQEEVDEEGKNIEREWKIHFSKKKLYSNSFCINTFSIKSPFIRLHGIKMSRIQVQLILNPSKNILVFADTQVAFKWQSLFNYGGKIQLYLFFNVCLETCVWFKKWYFLTSLNLSLDSSTEYHLKLSRKKTKKTCLKTFCQRKMEKWKTSKKYNGSQSINFSFRFVQIKLKRRREKDVCFLFATFKAKRKGIVFFSSSAVVTKLQLQTTLSNGKKLSIFLFLSIYLMSLEEIMKQ